MNAHEKAQALVQQMQTERKIISELRRVGQSTKLAESWLSVLVERYRNL